MDSTQEVPSAQRAQAPLKLLLSANYERADHEAQGCRLGRRKGGVSEQRIGPRAALAFVEEQNWRLPLLPLVRRRIKFGRNFVPAYNAQAAVTEEQIIVAAEITAEGGDFEQLDPVVTAAVRELQSADSEERPEVVLAEAGYCPTTNSDSLRARGMIPIVAPDTTRSRPRKTRLAGPYDFMRRVLATERGDELYSRRLGMVEPVFGPDQGQPAYRTLQTKRPGRRPLGMAPDRRHPQPAEAPPTHLAVATG